MAEIIPKNTPKEDFPQRKVLFSLYFLSFLLSDYPTKYTTAAAITARDTIPQKIGGR